MCLAHIALLTCKFFSRDTAEFHFRVTLPYIIIWIILVTKARSLNSTQDLVA